MATPNMTALEMTLRMREFDKRWASITDELMKSFFAPLQDKMFRYILDTYLKGQGYTLTTYDYPENLSWWERVLTWNPCNDFIPKVIRIEPLEIRK